MGSIGARPIFPSSSTFDSPQQSPAPRVRQTKASASASGPILKIPTTLRDTRLPEPSLPEWPLEVSPREAQKHAGDYAGHVLHVQEALANDTGEPLKQGLHTLDSELQSNNLNIESLGPLALEHVGPQQMLTMALKLGVLGKDTDQTELQAFIQVAGDLRETAIDASAKARQRAEEKLQEALKKMESMGLLTKIFGGLTGITLVIAAVLAVAILAATAAALVTLTAGMVMLIALATAAMMALAIQQAALAIGQAAMNMDYALTMNEVQKERNRAKAHDLQVERADDTQDKASEALNEIMTFGNEHIGLIQGLLEAHHQVQMNVIGGTTSASLPKDKKK